MMTYKNLKEVVDLIDLLDEPRTLEDDYWDEDIKENNVHAYMALWEECIGRSAYQNSKIQS